MIDEDEISCLRVIWVKMIESAQTGSRDSVPVQISPSLSPSCRGNPPQVVTHALGWCIGESAGIFTLTASEDDIGESAVLFTLSLN